MWRYRRVCYSLNNLDMLNQKESESTLNAKEVSNYCELSANKNNFECLAELQNNRASYQCKRDIGLAMTATMNAMRARKASSMFISLANAYGEANKIEKDCGNFQTAWTVFVDYMVAKSRRMGAKITYNLECQTGLYSAPKMVM